MLINEATAVLTSEILLVPYEEHHVLTYHAWMENEDIRSATASEPLSLEEEYAMQRAWRQDADKLTFISCRPPQEPVELVKAGKHDAPDRMLGDVNLFVMLSDGDAEGDGTIGEIELMIALRADQGKGFGKASLLAFLNYVAKHELEIVQKYCNRSADISKIDEGTRPIKYLRVKIGETNSRSIRLFESIGFERTEEKPNYFGEFELRLAGPLQERARTLNDEFGLGEYKEIPFCS